MLSGRGGGSLAIEEDMAVLHELVMIAVEGDAEMPFDELVVNPRIILLHTFDEGSSDRLRIQLLCNDLTVVSFPFLFLDAYRRDIGVMGKHSFRSCRIHNESVEKHVFTLRSLKAKSPRALSLTLRTFNSALFNVIRVF